MTDSIDKFLSPKDTENDSAVKVTPKKKTASTAKKKTESKRQKFEDAVANCCMGEPPTVKDLVQWYSGAGKEVAPKTIRDWVKKFGFYIDKNTGTVRKCEEETM